ncbi:MAG: hypothetical protein AAFX93_01140 [Verrucomicrobiota bacterium]
MLFCGSILAQATATIDGNLERLRAIEIIEKRYNEWASDIPTYQRLVERECGSFPEGQLYAYFLPAMSYAHLAKATPSNSKAYLANSRMLIEQGIRVAELILEVDDLSDLENYRHHATTLSTALLAIALYEKAGGPVDDFGKEKNVLIAVLKHALWQSNGGPIQSYPSYSWNFDTVASLTALRLAKPKDKEILEYWGKHLKWIENYGTDESTGLPYSVRGFGYSNEPKPPRGCDLFFRISLIAYVDQTEAQRLFKISRKTLERTVGSLYGFAEYPAGVRGAQDNDSGPIIMDLGLSATGLAIGAARATGNSDVAQHLCRQFAMRDVLFKLANTASNSKLPGAWFWSQVGINDDYFTGFLFGDACLFYSITWEPL